MLAGSTHAQTAPAAKPTARDDAIVVTGGRLECDLRRRQQPDQRPTISVKLSLSSLGRRRVVLPGHPHQALIATVDTQPIHQSE